jgi:hypothetical protein
MQRPIEEYVKHSDTLAQDMVNAWGVNMQTGNGPLLSAGFREVFETTCQFRTAKMIADSWRRAGIPTEAVDAEVEAKRRVFAQAFKTFYEKHEA